MVIWSNDLGLKSLVSACKVRCYFLALWKHDHNKYESMIITLRKAWSKTTETMIIKVLNAWSMCSQKHDHWLYTTYPQPEMMWSWFSGQTATNYALLSWNDDQGESFYLWYVGETRRELSQNDSDMKILIYISSF